VALTAVASSDADSDQLGYTWVQTSGPVVTLSDAHAAQPTFTAPEGLVNSTVTFELVVHDGSLSSVSDSVTITINADNDAPTANAGADQTVNEGDTVTLTGLGSSDPEAQGLTYTWVQTSGPAVTLSDPHAAQPTFTAPEGPLPSAQPGFAANDAPAPAVLQFSLTVSDGTNTSSVDTVTITVDSDDDPPTVNAGPDQRVGANTIVQLDAKASDPEGGNLTYQWVQVRGPAVTLSDSTIANPTFTAPSGEGGTIEFRVLARDGTSRAADEVAIEVAPTVAPVVEVRQPGSVQSNEFVAVEATARDPDGDPLTYRWTQVGGPSASLGKVDAPALGFVAPSVSASTDLVFQVEVSDGYATTVQTVSVRVNPAAAATNTDPPSGSGTTEPEIDDGPGTAVTEPVKPPVFVTEPAPPPLTPSSGGGPVAPPVAVQAQDEADDAHAATLASDPYPAVPEPTVEEPEVRRGWQPEAGAEENEGGAASEASLAAPDMVLAEAGRVVELTPRLLGDGASGETKVTWTQVSGTPTDVVEVEGGVLRVRMPEVFIEEELVFEVELFRDGQRVVQEVTVQV